MPYADRDTRLAYLKSYREHHTDARSRTDYNRERRDKLREAVRLVKDAPCLDCGGTFHHSAMDFDHRPDEAKIWDVNRLIARNAAVSTVMAEIAKCDLVCSNCHRIRTWVRDHDDEDKPLPTLGWSTASNESASAARARRRQAKNRKAAEVKAWLER